MRKVRLTILLSLLVASATNLWAQKHYDYETVENDPLKARIYTLDNGLKIYLTENKDQPRVQTYIAVRAGGKNDPHETTGLAHYFEHLMFKGTSSFGTYDYEKEKPLLDSITDLFEQYRLLKDEKERKAMYHRIDSISGLASHYAIANEYDKLMASIGSKGSNAYTSQDVTCYEEDIPNNEIENWAKIQSDRFRDNVIRGFHTELEAVYEEKNISLTKDFRKVTEKTFANLFPHHPYGTQTVLGTQEQLKNPSIVNIKNFYNEWYVPNNVAICMSGDIDMDKTVSIIDKYFGDWKPNPNLPKLQFEEEKPLTQPIVEDVYGPEADMVVLAWRFPGEKSKEYDYLKIITNILSNNKSGLFDLNLNQTQKVLESGSFDYGLADYSCLMALALPKEGQTLEEVKDLMLGEVNKIAKGEFDEDLLTAIVNNIRLQEMKEMESNEARATKFVNAFVDGKDWKDVVEEMGRLKSITKEDVMKFAGNTLTEGYSCIYKHKGVDPNEKKIDKPEISPIEMNRDKTSDYVTQIQNSYVEPIKPVFVDFATDLSTSKLKNGTELVYKKNEKNDLFTLVYRYERGNKADKGLDLASGYIDYLGAGDMTAEELKKELYKLACNVHIMVDESRTSIIINGLSENMEKAMSICDDMLNRPHVDQKVYDNMVEDIIKTREYIKLDQTKNFNKLFTWGIYGPDNNETNLYSNEELRQLDPQQLLNKLADLQNYEQVITYYGPLDQKAITKIIKKNHKMSKKPLPAIAQNVYEPLPTTQDEIYIAPYTAKNIYMRMLSIDSTPFDVSMTPNAELYNEYFGTGMNSIVFQELRESRGLAYNSYAYADNLGRAELPGYFVAHVISQNDKMMDCIKVFDDIIENMPQSEAAFPLAKESLLKRIASSRTINENVIMSYLKAKDLKIDHDINKDIYEKVSGMTLKDVVDYQQKYIKNRKYKYLILGDENELDMEQLKKIAPVKRVSTEEIFGY